MDITELRAQSARTGDQLAALAALDFPARAAIVAQWPNESGFAHLAGIQDVARWLSTGHISPALQRVLDAVGPHIQTPDGEAVG